MKLFFFNLFTCQQTWRTGSKNQFTLNKNCALWLGVGGESMVFPNLIAQIFLKIIADGLYTIQWKHLQIFIILWQHFRRVAYEKKNCSEKAAHDDCERKLQRSNEDLTTQKGHKDSGWGCVQWHKHVSAFGNIPPALIWGITVRNLNSHPPLSLGRSLYNDITSNIKPSVVVAISPS